MSGAKHLKLELDSSFAVDKRFLYRGGREAGIHLLARFRYQEFQAKVGHFSQYGSQMVNKEAVGRREQGEGAG